MEMWQTKVALVLELFPKEMEMGVALGLIVRPKDLAKEELIKTEPDAPVSRRTSHNVFAILAVHNKLKALVKKGRAGILLSFGRVGAWLVLTWAEVNTGDGGSYTSENGMGS